ASFESHGPPLPSSDGTGRCWPAQKSVEIRRRPNRRRLRAASGSDWLDWSSLAGDRIRRSKTSSLSSVRTSRRSAGLLQLLRTIVAIDHVLRSTIDQSGMKYGLG
ncbi:MAG: hypothetical protein ACXV5J_09755, partial [Candidatus Angelobacter sp.]